MYDVIKKLLGGYTANVKGVSLYTMGYGGMFTWEILKSEASQI
jgi:hypothetical protein